MKTTVELDEKKLLRVMELTGLKTRKEAIDYALSQAERAAKIAKLFGRPRRSKDELKKVLDPEYDLTALRAQEKPRWKCQPTHASGERLRTWLGNWIDAAPSCP